MKLCPICHRCYEDTDTSCPHDQTALVASRPGTRMISDKYRLDRLLGRGGMGAVYAGTHIDLDRPVAIKLLLSDFTSDTDALERFRREARAAARLNHPNVADTYDYGLLPDGGAYIVMELVEGQTLREYMDAASAMPIAEATEIARQVASGVDTAHRSGIVHRDLKPSNIILSRDHQGHLQAKVVDFGVAKLKEHTTTSGGGLTASGSLIGTPRYMSPEQCSGHTTDARSDIYSMGIILYEMLAGQPPFDAPTAMAIAVKQIQQPPPSLKEFRPDASVELDRFLRQVLDKDPEKRPQSAADFAKNLSEVTNELVASERADKQSPEQARLPQAEKSTVSRETNAFTPQAGTTYRAGAPTMEHSSAAQERVEGDPSVQGYVVPVETVTEVATKIASPHPQQRETVEIKPASAVAAKSISPAEAERNYAPEPGDTGSRRSALIYAVGIFALGFIAVAIWFALTRSSQENAADNSPSNGVAGTSQANQTPPAVSGTRATENPATADNSNGVSRNPKDTPRDARAELRTALGDWVAATNSRDINQQMAFYAPTLSVFYLKRNATQAYVRAEKTRLLSQSDSIDVRVGEPEIQIDADGRTATMRFHKSWSFNGARTESGEVIQELRWRKSDSGWKITSERDVEIIRIAR